MESFAKQDKANSFFLLKRLQLPRESRRLLFKCVIVLHFYTCGCGCIIHGVWKGSRVENPILECVETNCGIHV